MNPKTAQPLTMTYQQLQPPEHLKRYVRYFWVLEEDSPAGTLKTFRPITDGCPGLFFQPADAGTCCDQDKKQLPSLLLHGQTIRHRELRVAGRFAATGICFQPYALKSVFGLDAHELTDTCVDVNLLPRNYDHCLSEQLLNALSPAHRIELLSAFLMDQISRNRVLEDNLTDYALAQLISTKGAVSMKTLRETLNVSERSVERRFKQRVGVSPKLFSRICRFQASLTQLQTDKDAKLSDVAFDNGYADQSHFIRAFNEFAGFSPWHYRNQSTGVIQNLADRPQ